VPISVISKLWALTIKLDFRAWAEVDGTPSLVIHKDSQGANFADSMTGYLKL
jgi:hypothetical protein